MLGQVILGAERGLVDGQGKVVQGESAASESPASSGEPAIGPGVALDPSQIDQKHYRWPQTTDQIPVQSNQYSCGIACSTEVFRQLGVKITEAEMLERLGWDWEMLEHVRGISASHLARGLNEAVQKAGLSGIQFQGGNMRNPRKPMEEVSRDPGFYSYLTRNSDTPIFVNLHRHWVLLDELTQSGTDYFLHIRDPWGAHGPGSPWGIDAHVPIEDFATAWESTEYSFVRVLK